MSVIGVENRSESSSYPGETELNIVVAEYDGERDTRGE
jgi:hypothetical protein